MIKNWYDLHFKKNKKGKIQKEKGEKKKDQEIQSLKERVMHLEGKME